MPPAGRLLGRADTGTHGRVRKRFCLKPRARFRTTRDPSSDKARGQKNRARPAWGRARELNSRRSGLELEARAELNLTLAEERAVRRGRRTEGRVKCQRVAREVVEGRVDARDLRAVEEVEALGQYLEVHALLDLEAAREAHVEVPDFRLLEEVARRAREARRAARAVDAAARRVVRREAEGRRGDRARDVARVARAREGVKDGRERPAVEDRAADLVVLEAREVRVVDDARDELVAAVEVRQAVLGELVERVERQVARSERHGALAVVRRARERVVHLE